MKTVTIETVMSWGPCYGREKIEALADGHREISAAGILNLPIPHDDKLWAVLRNDFFSDRELREMACDFAQCSLPIFERDYPDDTRPRDCIETARRFARGEASEEESDAARAAAWAAARDAARAAVWDAAWDAARAAAGDAAGDAAGAVQIKIIRDYLAKQVKS